LAEEQVGRLNLNGRKGLVRAKSAVLRIGPTTMVVVSAMACISVASAQVGTATIGSPLAQAFGQ
jgi:hypothetical protein